MIFERLDPNNLSGRIAEPVFVGPARRWLIRPGDPNFPSSASSNTGLGTLARNTSREPGFRNPNLSMFRAFRLRFDALAKTATTLTTDAAGSYVFDAPASRAVLFHFEQLKARPRERRKS